MFQVFYINFYALLDPIDKFSFVTPLVPRKYDIVPDILNQPFFVITLVDDSVLARRVFRSCLVYFPSRVTWVDSVELYMVNFHVILEMD